MPHDALGPLREDGTVAIIGGGPAGLACALTLQREAARRGRACRILVFEGKTFGVHYNQCTGVLSPPLRRLLAEDFDLILPATLGCRDIAGYTLHGLRETVPLDGDEGEEHSLAVRRVEFDAFLATCALARGITILPTRVTDLEFQDDGVSVFTWSGTYQADVVVGAFGTSRAMTQTLRRRTAYRPPPLMTTMAAKIHPAGAGDMPGLLGDRIHTMLPPLPRVAFGALIPKSDHITALVAGHGVRSDDLAAFLALPPIRALLPAGSDHQPCYTGSFPIGLAGGSFGDRYVTVGDAAGLVRPFKGKGINSAFITGRLAALTILDAGISRAAFASFYRQCAEIVDDLPAGTLVRRLAWLASHTVGLDRIVRLARHDPLLREILFDCVSGQHPYRHILRRAANPALLLRLAGAMCGINMGD
jgi:flavin-dependent dehydrogenase